MDIRWILPPVADDPAVAGLARETGLDPVLARLLHRRGLVTPEAALQFLQPRLKGLEDPYLLPDMEKAVKRLLAAIDNDERIVLFGDYDVDGVTSLTLLHLMLEAYGRSVPCFLPHRIDEGYGMTREGVERCVEEHKPHLLVAVDCGTASAVEIARLASAGIDVVVLDHHECQSGLPECAAVVNPKRGDRFTYLCSVGIVFKLCHALLKARPVAGFDLREHLDLVAIGTVADLVPLCGENRVFVRAGLAQVARSRRPGVRALREVAAVGATVTARDVGFRLGPRLNASGRLHTAQESLELLQTADARRAESLAASLDSRNRERQRVEREVLVEAEAMLAGGFDAERDAAIVLGRRGWHHGVLGIVAARLMRAHHRPTLIVGFDDSGLGKGSGRSIAGLALVAALERCQELLEQFGGHEMAAGLTVSESKFAKFSDRFRQVAREILSDRDLVPRIELDGELDPSRVAMDFLGQHEMLEPFGIGNAQPLFLARAVAPDREPQVLKEKHLRFEIGRGARQVRAIYFGGAEHPLPRLPWDVAFHVERNEFRGSVTPQMHVKAIRHAKPA